MCIPCDAICFCRYPAPATAYFEEAARQICEAPELDVLKSFVENVLEGQLPSIPTFLAV